jgi:hypothetical protein
MLEQPPENHLLSYARPGTIKPKPLAIGAIPSPWGLMVVAMMLCPMLVGFRDRPGAMFIAELLSALFLMGRVLGVSPDSWRWRGQSAGAIVLTMLFGMEVVQAFDGLRVLDWWQAVYAWDRSRASIVLFLIGLGWLTFVELASFKLRRRRAMSGETS